MTPSEKAIELVDWFIPHMPPTTSKLTHAKQCAIKVCEEVIDTHFGNPIEGDYQTKVIEQIKAIKAQ